MNKEHNNSFIALDTKTGKVLKSVEYEWDSEKSIFIPELEKSFTTFTAKSGTQTFIHTCTSQAIAYLYAFWKKWTGLKWSRYYVVSIGGGAHWPNKIVRKKHEKER